MAAVRRWLEHEPVVAAALLALATWAITRYVTDSELAQILATLAAGLIGTVAARQNVWTTPSVRRERASAFRSGREAGERDGKAQTNVVRTSAAAQRLHPTSQARRERP